jgi:hypothetical protein
MIKLCTRRVALAAVTLCLLLHSGWVLAELIPMTLKGLVQEATVIAYGSSVPRSAVPPKASSTVRFQPVSVLKGKSLVKDEPIEVCNDPSDIESYDLRQFVEPYIIFATKARGCWMPVRGMISVVPIKADGAATWRIQGEPAAQPFTAFLMKITSLVRASADRTQSR